MNNTPKTNHGTNLLLRPYKEQLRDWPQAGRHIMAQFDADSIVVYQAYKPSTAHYAVDHQRFGGSFSYSRMSWIKPNFLWMMFRSGWASKEGQEHVLAVRLKRAFFDEILEAAVASSFGASRMASREEWQTAVDSSEVRLQWDPDHDPAGDCLERRAVQLGLRGRMLRRYGEEDVLAIEDITEFVIAQRRHVGHSLESLVTPQEEIYRPASTAALTNVGLDEIAISR